MKQPYEKPELEKVGLKTEESVLCICKGVGLSGPYGTNNGCIHHGFNCRDMYGVRK